MADITSRRVWAPFSTSRSFPTPGRRRIDGWAFSADLKTGVVLDALDTELVARKPDNVVPHSDRGSQYTSVAFGARCKEAAVRPSTGSVGDAYDNAMCESFFAALECELSMTSPLSDREARIAIFRFIEGFYNSSRGRSAWAIFCPSNTQGNMACAAAPRMLPERVCIASRHIGEI